MNISHHLRIYGYVQGVFFRESMCRKAQQLGITGWVRNRLDGSLEAMIQGNQEAVSTMIEWARTGPELARVDRMENSMGSGEYPDFEKRDTA